MCFSRSSEFKLGRAQGLTQNEGETDAEFRARVERHAARERDNMPASAPAARGGGRSVADIMAEKASSGYSNNASAPGRGGSKR